MLGVITGDIGSRRCAPNPDPNPNPDPHPGPNPNPDPNPNPNPDPDPNPNPHQVRAVVACQQFRTRDVHKLDALLLSTSQPSIEATTEVRIGCFSFFYHELAQQLLKAGRYREM